MTMRSSLKTIVRSRIRKWLNQKRKTLTAFSEIHQYNFNRKYIRCYFLVQTTEYVFNYLLEGTSLPVKSMSFRFIRSNINYYRNFFSSNCGHRHGEKNLNVYYGDAWRQYLHIMAKDFSQLKVKKSIAQFLTYDRRAVENGITFLWFFLPMQLKNEIRSLGLSL